MPPLIPSPPEPRRGVTAAGPPSPWIHRFAPLVRAGGPVLDLACGGGRHLRLFHALGHPVTGIDLDLRGVADLQGRPGIELVAADLENGRPWPLDPGRRFAGIVVANYLHRPLFPALLAALEPGGLLLYETFMMGNQRFGRPSSPAFLLRSGELLALASSHLATGHLTTGRLQIVAFEQGEVSSPKAAVVQRLAAVAEPAAAPDLDGDPEPRPLPVG